MSSIPNTPEVDEAGFTRVLSRSQRRKKTVQNKPIIPIAKSMDSQTSEQKIVAISAPIAPPKPPDPIEPVHQSCILASGFQHLSRENRENLLNDGPKVEIWHKGTKVFKISKRLIMAVSSLANRHLTANQTQPILRLPDYLDQEAIVCVLGYFTNVCRADFYKLKHPQDYKMAGAIYQVARHLETGGAEALVLSYLKNNIYNHNIGYPAMHSLLERCDGPHDPLFELIAKNLARIRYLGTATNAAMFAKFVADHPHLAAAMASIDAEHSEKRKKAQDERAARLEAEKKIADAVWVRPSVFRV